MKRALMAAAVVALPVGFLISSTVTGASTPPVVANGTATCTGLSGKIAFNPPLTNSGTSAETATASIKLAGCSTTATNIPAGGILTGKGSTTISSPTNACASLATSKPVKLTVKWTYKNSSGVVLAKLAPTVVSFSGYDVTSNAATDPGFDLPQDSGGTASIAAGGSFAGSDNGASSQANAFVTSTASTLGNKCGTSTGVPSLKLGAAGTSSDPSEAVAS